MKDRELLEDREKWIEENFDWIDYKGNDEDSKEYIKDMSIETVCWYIGQILLFGRIIKQNKMGEFNLPMGEVPLFKKKLEEYNTK